MILNDYDQVIKENFNLFDAPTRRMIVALEDSEQTQMLNALSNSLYKKITSDMNKIDFGSIPRSRGDITKVEKFEDTEECLNILKKLVQEYRQDTTIVDTVLEAITNIKQRKPQFMKGFATRNPLITSIYNLNVLAIEDSVSFLISVCIQYIKDPQTNTMRVAFDKVSYYNSKNNVIYEQLFSFNEACVNGNMDKVLNSVTTTGNGRGLKEAYEDIAIIAKVDGEPDRQIDIPGDPIEPNFKDVPNPNASVVQEEEPEEDAVGATDSTPATPDAVSSADVAINDKVSANESGIGVGAALFITSLPILIPTLINGLRFLIYFFINAGLKFADTLEVQANLIQLNAYSLQTSEYVDDGIEDKDRAVIVKKQLDVANKLKKWSNKIAMIFNKSNKKAKDQATKEMQDKYTAEDLKNDLPADIYNKSVLF